MELKIEFADKEIMSWGKPGRMMIKES